MDKTKIIFIVVSTALLFSCSSTGGNKAAIGAVTGGAIGVAACSATVSGKNMDVNSRLAVMFICGVAGALFGDRVGSYLDEEDKQIGTEVLNQNPDGMGRSWFNPKTGRIIIITPSSVSNLTSTESFCRNYTAEIIVNGQLIKENHTACRQSDGSWVEG